MKVSILGRPGSGKSTLANLLSGIFNIMVISSGDLARASGFADSQAEKTGQLDQDEAKIRMLVKQAIGDSDQYILDGFPRTINQIEEVRIPLEAIIYLNIDSDLPVGVFRLLERHRPDDTLKIIVARTRTYIQYTHPLVKYFSEQGLVLNINATGTIGETLRQAVVHMSNKGIIEASTHVHKLIAEFEKGNNGPNVSGGGTRRGNSSDREVNKEV